ncbi:MAG: NADH-quinone oxidoreductase subunit NuoF [Nitrospiraceae bacterium]|nr:MAG: NADH-quinone oxidoreductase subunit NuoF [Nitrospiraceae bacterium]
MNEILLRNRGTANLHTISVYREQGGYRALEKALSLQPDDVISIVQESGLRGRGGAGFPAGAKWRLLTRYRVKTVYLICNADEGEPGTFKDRYIMEFDPHCLIEGMTIAAYATGAHHGFIYIRGEYDWIERVLELALAEARTEGMLGHSIMGSGFSFYIDIYRGAGSYVCGEETALIESLEGKAGRPRLKPPFPAASGLYGEPTVIHNVTTLSFIPFIIINGPDAFKGIGKNRKEGTKLFGISGHVNRPGLYEYPMGTALRELIYEAAGGVRDGKGLKAVIPGGLSAPLLRADEIDVEMDFPSLNAAGTMLGSGGIIVLDEDTSIPRMAQKAAAFYAHESCGQCTPCREGTHMIKFLIDRINEGQGTGTDLEHILKLCRYIRGSTICAFGIAATMPIAAMIVKFRSEFEALLRS